MKRSKNADRESASAFASCAMGHDRATCACICRIAVRAKIVQPGYGPNTAFTRNSGNRMGGLFPEPYAAYAQRIFTSVSDRTAVTKTRDVAAVVWDAAHDETPALRFPAGPDAVALARG